MKIHVVGQTDESKNNDTTLTLIHKAAMIWCTVKVQPQICPLLSSLRDDIYTHLAMLVGTVPQLGGWVFLCLDRPWQTYRTKWKVNIRKAFLHYCFSYHTAYHNLIFYKFHIGTQRQTKD